MNFETENIEFKKQFTEKIYKEVIAFANTDGGIIYIGIDDNGNVTGLDNVDQEYTRITNGIRDAIMPDVTMFVRFTIQENKVVRITVNEGTNKPYYLKGTEIRNLLHVKKTRIFTLTKQMRELGLIAVAGRGKDKKYLLK